MGCASRQAQPQNRQFNPKINIAMLRRSASTMPGCGKSSPDFLASNDNMCGGERRRPCYAGGGLLRESQMRKYRIGAALVAGFVMMLAGPLSAQQRQQAPDSNLNAEDQLSPSQMQQPMPGAVAAPGGAPGHAPAKHTATAGSPAAAAVRSNAAIAASRVVACSGPFAKDSSNLKLAMVFDSRNVTFEDVAVGGSQGGASVLFPKDTKHRLEIWWANPASRSGTYLILINKQSTWGAPGGLKLGM